MTKQRPHTTTFACFQYACTFWAVYPKRTDVLQDKLRCTGIKYAKLVVRCALKEENLGNYKTQYRWSVTQKTQNIRELRLVPGTKTKNFLGRSLWIMGGGGEIKESFRKKVHTCLCSQRIHELCHRHW